MSKRSINTLNRILGGVLEWDCRIFQFGMSPSRIIYVIISLMAFPGIIFYLLAWIIIPDGPTDHLSYLKQGHGVTLPQMMTNWCV